jgi:hypothetical protein
VPWSAASGVLGEDLAQRIAQGQVAHVLVFLPLLNRAAQILKLRASKKAGIGAGRIPVTTPQAGAGAGES